MIHTGGKPHKCKQCNFSAIEAVSLRKHIMDHNLIEIQGIKDFSDNKHIGRQNERRTGR